MKIVKVPFCSGAMGRKKGIEKAPGEIVKCLKEFFLKESGILPFFEFSEIEVDNSDISMTNKKIFEFSRSLVMPAIMVGGDHSITYPSYMGMAKNPSTSGLVVFDSHLDCENDFSPPTHEDYLRALINEGFLKKENVLLIGIRNMHINEMEFAKKNKLKLYSMKEISNEGKAEIADAVMSVARKFDALYVSIDIDVLDPAFAPGTGYIEPGGMTTRELIYFVQRLKNLSNIRRWDLVEVNPDKDINNLTVMAAAKIIVEMC